MADTEEGILQDVMARIDRLEMRCAYQDEVIDDLNKVVVEQWGKLEQAMRRMQSLEDRVRDMQDRAATAPEDEPPPPHY